MRKTTGIKKVTIVIDSLSGGGAERVSCNLANYLYSKGWVVDVVTLSNKNDSYKLNDEIKRICLLNVGERVNKLRDKITEWKRLKHYVIKNQDVSCYVVMLPLTSFMLIKLKKYIKCDIVVSERNNPASYGFLNRFMMNYAAKRCDGLVVQTKAISNYYKNVRTKTIIPNAINKDVILPQRRTVQKKIVAVGRLRKQKNYPMIISAFRQFSAKYPDYVLEIYGDGSEERKIKSIIKKYGLGDKVRLFGYVKDITNRITDASCFIMASNFEGMPNALIEAMCIGLPCVVTDCDGGGAKELITNMENGILVPKDATREMALGMGKIVEDTKLS